MTIALIYLVKGKDLIQMHDLAAQYFQMEMSLAGNRQILFVIKSENLSQVVVAFTGNLQICNNASV